MRKLLAMLLSLGFFAATAHAGDIVSDTTLYNKLKEKGALTDDDIKELKNATPRIELGGRFEFQYKNVFGDNTAASPVTDTFLIRRARIEVKAQLTPIAFVRIEPEFGQTVKAPVATATCTSAAVTAGTDTPANNTACKIATTGSQTVYLEDAYIGITPAGMGEFDLGNHYVPFSLEALTSDKKLAFVERNLTANLAPYRQLGVSWQHEVVNRTVIYQLGVYNGYVQPGSLAGPIYGLNALTNDNQQYMYGARLEWQPLGYMGAGIYASQENFEHFDNRVGLGLAWYSSADAPKNGGTAAASTERGSNGIDVDLQYKGGPFWAAVEYIARNVDYWDAAKLDKTAKQSSYTVQASWMFIPDTASLALRLENMAYDGDKLIKGASGQEADAWTTIGLNWYLLKNNIHLQANYVMKGETMPNGGTAPKNDTFLAMAIYHF
jgi:phosphate-selective porin